MSETLVETDRKPKYIGGSHESGNDIPVNIKETGEVILVEGNEMKICNSAYNSPEFHEFKDMTNEQIIHEIHNINSCKFHPNIAGGGDWIICKAAVNDKKKRNISGTIKEILDIIQGEHGCKVSWQESESTMENGGIVPDSENSNNFVKIITKDEIKNVLSGKSQVRHGSDIQAVASYLRGSSSTIYASKSTEERGDKQQEKEKLKKYATENNLWFDTSILGDYVNEGAEQKVFLPNEKEVIKLNDTFFYNSWVDYFQSLLLHNLFFPDTAYEFLGITEYSGFLAVAVKQPFVKITEETDMDAVKEFMSDNGFVNTKDNDYKNPELGIIIEDLHEANVLTENGVLLFIDTVFFITNEFKDGGPVEVDPEIKERWDKKKEHITTLANNIHRLKAHITKALQSKNEKERLTALAIETMFYTGERVGNEDSAANNHRGISGLKKSNVKCEKGETTLSYVGKSGVKHNKIIRGDRLTSHIKKALKNAKGYYLFCTSDGKRITPDMINNFLSKYELTSKDIRGYVANRWLLHKLENAETPKEEKDRKKLFNKLAKKVAARVGHSTSMLKNSYLAPELEDDYINKGKIIDLKKLYTGGGKVEKATARVIGKGCLMLSLHVPAWQKYLDVIKKEDIYNEPGYGLETEPHVTIIYGFDDEKTNVSELMEKVYKYIDKPIQLKATSISLFENDAPYDVIKIDIVSPLLKILNSYLMKEYSIKSDFPDYHAHATIAYVKKGKGKKYIKSNPIPINFEGTEIIYSHPDDSYSGTGKKKEVFPLKHNIVTVGGPVDQEITPKSLPIIQKGTPEGDTILRKVSVPVTKDYPGLKQFIVDIKKTTIDNMGLGLAAPQVGKNIRLFVVAPQLINPKVLINPELLESKGEWISEESCLSIPGESVKVKRAQEIKVKYLDEDFVEHTETLEGKEAAIFIHELDHLDGVLITDKKFEDGGPIKTELVFTDEDAVKEYCKKNADMYLTECNLKRIVLHDGNIYIFAKQNKNGELIYVFEEPKLNKNLRNLLEVLKSN